MCFVLTYLCQTGRIVEKGAVENVFSERLLVDSNKSLFHARVINFWREIDTILQQMHVGSFDQLKVI